MTKSRAEYQREWAKRNPHKRKEYRVRSDSKRKNQPIRRWTVLLSLCKLKSKRQQGKQLLAITKDEFLTWAELNTHCVYCKREDLGTGHGIDRVDSNKPYELNNIKACCKFCNAAKNTMTVEEFREQTKRIHETFQDQVSKT